jgi:hypothetical protein
MENQIFYNRLMSLIEKSNYGQVADYEISLADESYLEDESGLLRLWDDNTKLYTETVTEYLFRLFDYYFPEV